MRQVFVGRAILAGLALAGLVFVVTGCARKTGGATSTGSTGAGDLAASVVAEYRSYVVAETDALVLGTERLVAAVEQGDLAGAKDLYAPVRMHYERIEPIAEALGDLDPRIDAREGDVPDAEWQGFHRLEKLLWVDGTTEGGSDNIRRLLEDVRLLRSHVESAEITRTSLVTGAVELLNEVSTSKVTGEEERYSHTDLWDFAANVEGSRRIFTLLQPEISAKDAALATRIDGAFQALMTALDNHRAGEGYVLYTALTSAETRALSQALDAVAEPLSRVGALLGG